MNDRPADLTDLDDAELLTTVRECRVAADAAFEELYRRHHGAALHVARRLAGPERAQEIVSEAFVRILSLLRRGAGPRSTFRAYMAATLNSVWVDQLRATSRHVLVDDHERFEPLLAVDDGAAARAEAGVIGSAFAALPDRWQSVLWMACVDDVAYDEIGHLLDLSPNAVAALVKRAREGLRQSYLSEHLGIREDPKCLEVAPLLAGYVRGRSSGRTVRRVESHLDGCAACQATVCELEGMSLRLGAFLLPAVAAIALAGPQHVKGLLLGDPGVVDGAALVLQGAGVVVAGAAGAGLSGVAGAGVAAGGTFSGAGVSGAIVTLAVLAALGVAGVVAQGARDDMLREVEIAGTTSSDPGLPIALPPVPAVPVPPVPVPALLEPAVPVPALPEPPVSPSPASAPAPAVPAPSAPPVTPPLTGTPVDPGPEVPALDPRIDAANIVVTTSPWLPCWSHVSVPLADVTDGATLDLVVHDAATVVVNPGSIWAFPWGQEWATSIAAPLDALELDIQHFGHATVTMTLRELGIASPGEATGNNTAVVDLG